MRMNSTVVENGSEMTNLDCAYDMGDNQFSVAVVESTSLRSRLP